MPLKFETCPVWGGSMVRDCRTFTHPIRTGLIGMLDIKLAIHHH